MSSSTKIFVGLLLGVFVGVFLGEHASVFKIAADGFVKLLQMTVLPYIILSIITSLGALSYDQVKTLGLRAGTVLIGVWGIALVFTFLIPFAFPAVETASFFSSMLVDHSQCAALDRVIPVESVASSAPANHWTKVQYTVRPYFDN